MIKASIEIAGQIDDPVRYLTLSLHPAYGPTADVAHWLLTLALVAAEWPVAIDSEDTLRVLPPRSVRSVLTWDCDTAD